MDTDYSHKHVILNEHQCITACAVGWSDRSRCCDTEAVADRQDLLPFLRTRILSVNANRIYCLRVDRNPNSLKPGSEQTTTKRVYRQPATSLFHTMPPLIYRTECDVHTNASSFSKHTGRPNPVSPAFHYGRFAHVPRVIVFFTVALDKTDSARLIAPFFSVFTAPNT